MDEIFEDLEPKDTKDEKKEEVAIVEQVHENRENKDEAPLMQENPVGTVKEEKPKKMKPLHIALIAIACVVVLVCFTVMGVFIGANTGINKDMPLMVEAYKLVKKYYYEDISWKEFQELAAAGAFSQVDNFTGIHNLTPVGGIKRMGTTIKSDIYNNHAINFIVPNSPASQAKAYARVPQNDEDNPQEIVDESKKYPLSIGDELYAISLNGEWVKVQHAGNNLIGNIINQNQGDFIKLRVIKYGILYNLPDGKIGKSEDLFYFDYIIPLEVLENKLAYYYSPREITSMSERQDTAMIKLLEFSDGAPLDFLRCVRQFELDPLRPNKLILDLRGNGGGDAQILAFIANFLIDSDKSELLLELDARQSNGKFKREPLYTINKFDSKEGQISSEYIGNYKDNFEVTVLCDGGTASSSEVLIGDLMYYNKIKIVGTTTYGKGVGQRVFPVNGGKQHLYVTNGKYYLPSYEENGKVVCRTNIHGVGFTPLDENLIDANRRPTDFKNDVYIRKALETFK